MKTLVTVLISGVLFVAGTAFGDANKPLKPPRVYTGVHQPNGHPTKANSFAPRPGGSRRHVYGAPIQSPIFKMQPKAQPSRQAPKTSSAR